MSDYAALYGEAFDRYKARALWNVRRLESPTPEDAVIVAAYLRREGNREARELAERIESLCRAAATHAAH
jgi:hypothetical protein